MLVACGSAIAGEGAWPKSWVSKELADHPLVGKIYAPHAKKFIPPKDYLQSLVWPRFVLLGEVHDNPDHHILQALAIRSLGSGQPHVVFEHFQTHQQSLIDAFQSGLDKTDKVVGDEAATRLFLVTNWPSSGWPKQDIFRPLVNAVLTAPGQDPCRQSAARAGAQDGAIGA